MNDLNTFEHVLPSWLPPGLFYVLLGAAVFVLLMAFAVLFGLTEGQHASRRRLRALKERQAELRGEMVKSKRRKRPEASVNLMRRVVNRFRLLKSDGVAQAQSLIIEAGYRSRDALVVYAFFSLAAPIVFLLLGLTVMEMHIWGESGGMGEKARFIAPVALLYFGYKLPTWVVAFRRRKRYTAIQHALADTLDLMTICAEAGLSLATALERVSRELGIAYPEMAEELALVATELGFLPERARALQNLADRVKLPEIRGIVSVLIQTEKYGTPIAQAMRVLSAEFREQRMLRAENKAARLPALMTLPVVCFILPTLFIVIIAPAAIKIMDQFK